MLTIHLVTLFPSIFDGWLQQGVVSRAIEHDITALDLVDLRPFGVGRHHVTDDYPFGGGVGMVMKPEPVFAAVDSIPAEERGRVILLSPRGHVFNQSIARELAGISSFTLLAGHYEGVDERIREHLIDDELSIGDYVLSAGELAAMVVVDAVVRLLPGALSEGAAEEESFASNLLEYPHYTRPAEFRGWEVPEVLLSGHHAEIERWRRRKAIETTGALRPDLLESADVTNEEREWAESLVDNGD